MGGRGSGRKSEGGASRAQSEKPSKDAAPASGASPRPAPSPASAKAGAEASGGSLSDLAEHLLKSRAGDERRAVAKPTAGERPGAERREEPKGKPAGKGKAASAEPVDEAVADSLALTMAEGEAALGALFVPADKAADVQKRGAKMLHFAWKYHFIQNGVTALPSWAVLLLAHIGFLASLLVPNKERVLAWWDGVLGKVKPKEGQHQPPKAEAPQRPAPKVPEGTPTGKGGEPLTVIEGFQGLKKDPALEGAHA